MKKLLQIRDFRATKPGLTKGLIVEISKQKNEPDWMLKKRLRAYKLFKDAPMPKWGPDLSKLNFDEIRFFVQPNVKETTRWEDLPEDIRATAERIGVPKAERNLSGSGFQYDSNVIYHALKKDLESKGVIFENMDKAIHKHPELVKKYFMTNCVPINDHKFAMLHAAVWSGGTFIYIPPGVKVEMPLQAYFRMNAKQAGQFEHTLIIADKGSELHYIEGCSAPIYNKESLHAGCVEIYVMEGAKVRYSSVENWSKNVYNLNTKRAVVHENGKIEWVNSNFGSGTTMLYPSSVLVGAGAVSNSIGIALAVKGQNQDVGVKVIHAAPNTNSTVWAKSISKGGISSYRGLVKVAKKANNCSCSVDCDTLLIGKNSISNTYPVMLTENKYVEVSHEARVGRIGEDEIFYLMSRGLSEKQAIQNIVLGFAEPIVKQLPVEYAVELNRLIEYEMEV